MRGLSQRNNRAGSPPEFPSLLFICQKRYTPEQIAGIIAQGRGRMPACSPP